MVCQPFTLTVLSLKTARKCYKNHFFFFCCSSEVHTALSFLSLSRKTVKPKTDLFSSPRAEVHQRFLGNTHSNSLHTTHYTCTYSSMQAPHKALTFGPEVITQHTHMNTSNFCYKTLAFCQKFMKTL